MVQILVFLHVVGMLGLAVVACPLLTQQAQPTPIRPPVIIRESRRPVPTPVLDCSPVESDMKVKIDVLNEREILLTLEGFEPGESVWFRFQTKDRTGSEFSIETSPLPTVDEKGTFVLKEQLPTREQHGDGHWDVAIAHSRGVVCTEVTMP